MDIKKACEFYFSACSQLNRTGNSSTQNRLAKICVASYFFIFPPVLLGIGYLIARVSEACCSRTEQKTARVAQGAGVFTGSTDSIVDILNNKKYTAPSGKVITLPQPSKPEFYVVYEGRYQQILEQQRKVSDNLKQSLRQEVDEKTAAAGFRKGWIEYVDQSTEIAIANSEMHPIALNFANEEHAGGNPGYYKDLSTGLFKQSGPPARAQEESLCQRSDLFASLTQVDGLFTKYAEWAGRSLNYYPDKGFDSRYKALISENSLFGIQSKVGLEKAIYLEEPKQVTFITSAAKSYGRDFQVSHSDFQKGTDVYKDAQSRIETHLLAAASSALVHKMNRRPVNLILGAFGCGAFAPPKNPDKYREMIAGIYKDLLPSFTFAFDKVTFAVPTFGDKSGAAFDNHQIFKRIIQPQP